MLSFSNFWRANNGHSFSKSRLTADEIREVQELISRMEEESIPSGKIIDALQELNPAKLTPRWKAERAFWTELKYEDTAAIKETGDEIGFSNYTVLLSPNACQKCILKTNNGKRIFSEEEIRDTANTPPYHPNCYCVLIPYD